MERRPAAQIATTAVQAARGYPPDPPLVFRDGPAVRDRSLDLPRMETQPKSRKTLPNGVSGSVPADPPTWPARPLISAVRTGRARQPATIPNTDEGLLNRAYVYAMRARLADARLRRPLFRPSDRSRRHPDRYRLDNATIVTALLHDVIEDTQVTRAEIDQLFGEEIGDWSRA